MECFMAIPAYLFLKDDGGANIKGSVDVKNREGSIEVTGFSHNLSSPTDAFTGKATGTRKHGAVLFQKDFDSSDIKYGNWYYLPPFGDDPNDQTWIKSGINYAKRTGF